ncbi:hypothetical protein P9D34_03785 [Bacillus swezeyi]|uniref:Uncharacterized protein n=1 Tax=Bacillus swezeyi TaxID=1925020 RepID=A0A1R1QCH0_9BACI|nr:hypothetical protein [Bacillus swezeyi]MEC1259578.1 hypothetical protein [Bacillus swezeyi]MED2927459.1 hypothetical protein [Bacillus swezeyi]MED2941711.1 hypothetical protein [Bacillus swezeyi]MED2962657.1 hypothetical protein [Bacillus swezeyi]MED3071888.1 hypothetical protein [Bacillus swezeyi]
MSHFKKHGGEFQDLYRNADEYLDGARDVVKNDIKVEYKYKDGIRIDYVRFMGNSRRGEAKFEFVGTNHNLPYSKRKKFWKTINNSYKPS